MLTLQNRADLMRGEATNLLRRAHTLHDILHNPFVKDAPSRVDALIKEINTALKTLRTHQAFFPAEED